MPSAAFSITKNGFIRVEPPSIKRSNQFTCMGWISRPVIPTTDPLCLLAVEDLDGDATTDAAIRIELLKDGTDYRMQFAHSKSKKIKYSTTIDLDDNQWHLLSYVCHGEGQMSYYVDAVYVAPEIGLGEEGIPYSVAWSRSGRVGGGSVWVPFLNQTGQGVSIYNWRFGSGFTIHQGWIQELMTIDQAILSA